MLGLGHIPLNPRVLDELATVSSWGYANRVDLAAPVVSVVEAVGLRGLRNEQFP
jgi:hypothetical protein